MSGRAARTWVLGAALVALAVGGVACGADTPDAAAGTTPGAGTPGPTIALLLPSTDITRFEARDRPAFEAAVAARCPDCRVLYQNAGADAARQQAQAEAVIADGADVLVLDAVGESAQAIIARAKAAGVSVVGYDQLVRDSDLDAFVSFQNDEVGRLQARALVAALQAAGKPTGTVVVLNGSPDTPIAAEFKRGAHEVLDTSGLRIGAEYDVVAWSPAKAQEQMEQAITALGPQGIDGVHAVGDAIAEAAIAAFKGAGVTPLPPVTGQDAELAAIQRILAGEQLMTVEKKVERQAEVAAEIAVALAQGRRPPADLFNAQLDNGAKQVPSVLLEPTVIDRSNVATTVVADGLYTVEQICTPDFAQACVAAGLR